jgi:hypothetical protein
MHAGLFRGDHAKTFGFMSSGLFDWALQARLVSWRVGCVDAHVPSSFWASLAPVERVFVV